MAGSAPSDTPGARTLVGRRLVLDALRLAVDDAVGGRGGLVLLTGDPGIGKTAAATDAAGYATRRGARVVWATCWDGDGAPAFWPWTQVLGRLDPPAGALPGASPAGALPGASPAGAAEGDEQAVRFRIFDAVAQQLRSSATDRPLVVVLDDLHRADASSIRLLAFLARQVPDVPLLLVGAYRDVEVAEAGHPLHDLLPAVAERAQAFPLVGLDAAAVTQLVRRLLGRPVPDEVVTAVHQRTGGNPFFVEQLIRLLDTRPDPAGPLPEASPVIGDVVARRLARLPAATRRLLDAGAVLGTEFDLAVAAAAAGLDLAEAVAALDDAVLARVIAEPGPATARFARDLFREVLTARQPAQSRCRLHLAVAELLEAQRAAGRLVSPRTVAHHRLPRCRSGTGPAPSRRCWRPPGTPPAGERSTRPRSAYRRVLEMPGETRAPAPAMLVEFAHALRRAGRPGDAYARFSPRPTAPGPTATPPRSSGPPSGRTAWPPGPTSSTPRWWRCWRRRWRPPPGSAPRNAASCSPPSPGSSPTARPGTSRGPRPSFGRRSGRRAKPATRRSCPTPCGRWSTSAGAREPHGSAWISPRSSRRSRVPRASRNWSSRRCSPASSRCWSWPTRPGRPPWTSSPGWPRRLGCRTTGTWRCPDGRPGPA